MAEENTLIDSFTFSPPLEMEYNTVIGMFSSNHWQSCCENHELDFDSTKEEFETAKKFIEKVDKIDVRRVEGFGITIRMYDGDKEYCISVPGRGSNNGYYGDNIELVIKLPSGEEKKYDVTECQSY